MSTAKFLVPAPEQRIQFYREQADLARQKADTSALPEPDIQALPLEAALWERAASRLDAPSGKRSRGGFLATSAEEPRDEDRVLEDAMGIYRKRNAATVAEAEQLTEDADPDQFIGVLYSPTTHTACVSTPEGDVCANIGDWIVQTGAGEFEVLSAGAFNDTYEAIPRTLNGVIEPRTVEEVR